MNLFGKAKAAKTTPKDAIIRLRESLEMLTKRENYLQTKIDNELRIAKTNATKNKRGMYILSLYSYTDDGLSWFGLNTAEWRFCKLNWIAGLLNGRATIVLNGRTFWTLIISILISQTTTIAIHHLTPTAHSIVLTTFRACKLKPSFQIHF